MKATVLVLVAYFIVLRMKPHWNEVLDYKLRVRWGLMGLSFLLLLTAHILSGIGWRIVLSALGESLDRAACMRIYLQSQLGKYLPGNVFHLFGRLYLAEESGVRRGPAILSLYIEMALACLTAVAAFSLTLPFYDSPVGVAGRLPTLLFVPVGLLAVHPRFLGPLLRRGLRLIGKRIDPPVYPYGKILQAAAFYLFLWILIAGAFCLMCLSATPLPPRLAPQAGGYFLVAFVAGLLSFLPGGILVREGSLTVLLATLIPLADAGAAAILARVWMTLSELTGVLIVTVVRLPGGRPPERAPEEEDEIKPGTEDPAEKNS